MCPFERKHSEMILLWLPFCTFFVLKVDLQEIAPYNKIFRILVYSLHLVNIYFRLLEI